METTVTAVLQQLGELFHTFHELFIWMDQLGGDEFRGRVKKIYFLVAAIPCNMRRQLGNYETTRQIFEFHGFGLSLLSIDCVNVSTANGNLRINWSSEKIDLAMRLLPAFSTPSGMPIYAVNTES